jgi:TusA-related sulfurtransferase
MAEAPDDTFASGLQICYEVLLYLSSRLSRLKPGEVLEFISDDPEAADKIPEWCDARDYTLLRQEPLLDGRTRFLIQKPNTSDASDKPNQA